MSSQEIAIKIENISKLYRIGAKQENYDNLLSAFLNFLKSPVTNFRRYRSLYRFNDIEMNNHADPVNSPSDILWALKNVTFEIEKGDVVGVIGPNGAGKSTLLKILCQITTPTIGQAEIHGRVASLLEVGTGFHQELTGKENVYLNGAILGMRKIEIDKRFDEIVDFSGVERFIDTPVKRYSSGMRVRLAFSVAAHLQPEILIVDEVLAVGDERFQKKCLSKMENVAQKGRTVVFVSHSMPAIIRLCKRVVLLESGTVSADGPPAETVARYIGSDSQTSAERVWPEIEKAPGNDSVRICAVRAYAKDTPVSDSVNIRSPVALEVEYEILEAGKVLATHFHLDNDLGIRVFSVHETDPEWRGRPRPAGRYCSRTWIPGDFLSEGILYVSVAVLSMKPVKTQSWVEEAISFVVVDSFDGEGARGDWTGKMAGAVRPLLNWETEFKVA